MLANYAGRILLLVITLSLVGCNIEDDRVSVGNANTGGADAGDSDTNTCDLNCLSGTCELQGDAAICVCDPGYSGELCDSCDEGFQDNDADGVCLADCSGLECGNGMCDHSSGEALCVCDTGYGGDSCETCADTYQDNDGDGVCDMACDNDMVTLDCGEGVCDDSTGLPTCGCPVGANYIDDAMVCDLTVPADPEFDDPVDTTPWTAVGSARLEPGTAGTVNPGAARFGEDVCRLGGFTRQEYDLAPRAETGPLKAVIDYTIACDVRCFDAPGVALRFGTGFQGLPRQSVRRAGPYSNEICVGEGGYGLATTLDVVSSTPPQDRCDAYIDLIDSIRYERATDEECPAPGAIVNGEFDMGTDSTVPGWETTPSGSAETQIVTADENAVLSLKPNAICSRASASTTFAVPSGTAAYALRYNYRLLAGGTMTAAVGTNPSGGIGYTFSHTPVDTFQSNSICLPRWMNGTYQLLNFTLSGGSGVCGEPSPNEGQIDTVEIVPAPECGEAEILRDGGFDRVSDSPWVLRDGYSATAGFVSQNGDQFVQLTAGECDAPSASQSILIPPGMNQPNAVRARYRYADDADTSATLRIVPTFERTTLEDTGGAWQEAEVCIPPNAQGYPLTVVGAMSSSGLCAPGNPLAASLELDDFELVTSASCP